MTNSELLRRWYEALFWKDCIAVMELLKKEPSLLKEGWKVDSTRWVDTTRWHDGRPFEGSEGNQLAWKARTALHVGATRGCVDLIKQVLLLCNLEAVKNYGAVEEQHTATESRGDLVAKPGQSDSAKSHLDFSLTREELRDLLLCKDGVYELEPLALGAIHYNLDIINLLVYALGECDNPPYGIDRGIPGLPKAKHDDARADSLESLRQAFHVFIENLERDVGGDCVSQCLSHYAKHPEFNFLPREEYFFHFLSSRWGELAIGEGEKNWSFCREVFWQVVRSMKDSLGFFLLKLPDGQGRTPFHVALSWFTAKQFVELFTNYADQEMLICALTSRDGAGRTPLHRAAATAESLENMDSILKYCEKSKEVSASCCAAWIHPLGTLDLALRSGEYRTRDAGKSDTGPHRATYVALSRKYGFSRFACPFNPLYLAVINGQYSNAKHLMTRYRELGMESDTWYFKDYRQVFEQKTYFQNLKKGDKEAAVIEWGLIEFAYWARADNRFIEYLVQDSLDRTKAKDGLKAGAEWMLKRPKQRRFHPHQDIREAFSLQPEEEQDLTGATLTLPWKAIHLAAAAGDYVTLKTFIDYQYDPLSQDFEGNNALHYALKVRQFLQFRKSILHYMTYETFREELGTQQTTSKDAESKNKEGTQGIIVAGDANSEDRPEDRVGCVHLLLQLGRDIFKYNNYKRAPEPQGDLVRNGKFCAWWFDQQKKELTDFLGKLNTASSAISVTATLIATASYVGPLTPPLGYDPKTDQVQYENVWVATFIFCDLLSFYLAIVAITVALIPSLPMWQETAVEELRKTQQMVTLGVCMLTPSILCFLIAFISSSIAAESARYSSTGGRLTIAALCIGGPLFLVVIFLFLLRLIDGLLPNLLPKSEKLKTHTYSQ